MAEDRPADLGRRMQIFADPSWLPTGAKPLPLLRPLWNCVEPEASFLNAGRFDEYYQVADKLFVLSTIDECDFVLYPAEWNPQRPDSRIHEVASLARGRGKPMVVMSIHDSDDPIPVDSAIVFRTSLYASRRLPNEHALPCWSVDFMAAYGQGKPRVLPKLPRPTIGYVGYVDFLPGRTVAHTLVRAFRSRKAAHIGAVLRGRAVRSLLSSPGVEARVVVRAGGLTGLATMEQRLEYAHNMFDNAYALVCRGGGNYSYRLYEVLSCGRIPVVIDSDCVFPFDKYIDWDQCILRVPASQASHLATVLTKLHEAMSEREFQHRQLQARRIYDEWIKPRAFYSNLWRLLA